MCQLESRLFQHFFPRAEEESGALAPLVEPLCMVLYDMLRPAFIQLQDLDDLCELVDILLHEVSASTQLQPDICQLARLACWSLPIMSQGQHVQFACPGARWQTTVCIGAHAIPTHSLCQFSPCWELGHAVLCRTVLQ